MTENKGRFGEALEAVREDFALIDDPYSPTQISQADNLILSLQGIDEASFQALMTHFPSSWNRILLIAYERLPREDRRSRELLFRLMRQQMCPSLNASIWRAVQRRHPDPPIADFYLPYLAEHEDHFRGQPSIEAGLSQSLQRLTRAEILPNPDADPELLLNWAARYQLDLTSPLGAQVLGESAWLWQPTHFHHFADLLYPAIPAMEPRLGGSLLRASYSPDIYTPQLQDTIHRALYHTYPDLHDDSRPNFWLETPASVGQAFSAYVIENECRIQTPNRPLHAYILESANHAIRHVHRLNDDTLIMDLGRYLLIDQRSQDDEVFLLDKDTLRSLLAQGRSLEETIANLSTARIWGETLEDAPEGRLRLLLHGASLVHTERLLSTILDTELNLVGTAALYQAPEA